MEGFTLKEIEISDIDQSFPYQCRYTLSDEDLVKSVKEIGILMPIVVTESVPHRIVSGHRRVWAAKQLGLRLIPAMIVRKQDSELNAFRMAVVANWKHDWQDLDRAYVIGKLIDQFALSREVVRDEFFPALALSDKKGALESYLRISRLQSEVLDGVAQDRLPIRGIDRLSRLSGDEQIAFVRLITSRIRLTVGQLIHASDWIVDLLKSTGKDLQSLLEDSGLEDHLKGQDSDARQRTEAFYGALRELRFPKICASEAKFQAALDGLTGQQQDLTIEAPQDFEAEGFTMRARVRSPEALQRIMRHLEDRKSELNSLFDIML